jgi:hypothetical protein
LGISRDYGKKDSEVGQFLKKICGLSLLPPAEVCDFFALEFLSNLLNDKQWNSFATTCWKIILMQAALFLRLFSPNVLHHHLRTINACVSFHAHFSALFYSAHLNVFVLVSSLQKIQYETYIKMRSVTTQRFKKSYSFKKEDFIS